MSNVKIDFNDVLTEEELEWLSKEEQDELLASYLDDRWWRLTSGRLYKIRDKNGFVIPFKPNKSQLHFLKHRHTKNIILKARQLGFSTLIEIIILDEIIFDDFMCGVISRSKDNAKDIFNNKIKFAFENMPEWLRSWVSKEKDNAFEIKIDWGWEVSVGTSFRWGTLQHLHLSEFGKICARRPDDAKEIVTGALNTVGIWNMVDIESTAEWRSWAFFYMTQKAIEKKEKWVELWPLDYKFHFFPWREDSSYVLDPKYTVITQETRSYFKSLSKVLNKEFSEEQIAWYQAKEEEQMAVWENMMAEYPSTPEEAFNVAIKGAYYEKQMTLARKQNRICKVAYDNTMPVHTAWDLGGASQTGDETAIWFFQLFGREIRLIDYWEANGYTILECINVVREKGYKPWENYWPWDLKKTLYSTGKTIERTARENGFNFIRLAKTGVMDWIDLARGIFSRCVFDEENCAKWLNALQKYQQEWDKTNGCWKNKPKHGQESHGADAFRYLANAMERIDWEIFGDISDDYEPVDMEVF